MDSLAALVSATIQRRGLFRAGERIVVALSGGPDSVALAHLLSRGACDLGVVVDGVAHFNHQLRDGAAGDEAFCREFAARWGMRFFVDRANVRAEATRGRRNVEDTARELRYAFLERARLEAGAAHVAVAHTRDDQAETVLLRLLRGAGPLGLRAILPVRDRVIRPFLDVTRADIEAYCERHRLSARHDESNDDLSFVRNRVRHELLPYLRQHFSPRIVEGLAQHADQAHELSLWVAHLATQQASKIVLRTRRGVEIDAAALMREPRALRRVLLLETLREAAGGRFVGADQVVGVEDMLLGRGPSRLDLPGQRAWIERGTLVLEMRRSAPRRRRGVGETAANVPAAGQPTARPVPLPVPGTAACPGGWRVVAERADTTGGAEFKLDHSDAPDFAATISSDETELFVRSRRAGDLLRPIGFGGRKKLQDLFVDRKVARDDRGTWPIVVDGRDRVIWVVGLAQAADFQVREGERGVILLKAKRLGG
jgi:tRNA(Ile)-lysidine synthase